LLSIVAKNVRLPEIVLGDLESQVASCNVAEREFLKLVEQYGLPTLEQHLASLLDYAERLTRAELATWPDGVYRFEDFIDDDGIDEQPIPLRVTLTVRGDQLTADFTGTAPQVKGAINSTPSF